MTPRERFTSVVLDGHKGLAFEIPFSPGSLWGLADEPLWPGRRGYRVRGSVNRVKFESVVVPRARRFFVLVDQTMMKACRLEAGATVRVTLGPAGDAGAPSGRRS